MSPCILVVMSVFWVTVAFPLAWSGQFSSDLCHQPGVFTQKTATHWIFFFLISLETIEMAMCKNHSKLVVSEILKSAHLAPTTTLHSKSLKLSLFSILMLSLNLRKLSLPCLLAYMFWVAVVPFIDYIFAIESSWPGIPNKVSRECVYLYFLNKD